MVGTYDGQKKIDVAIRYSLSILFFCNIHKFKTSPEEDLRKTVTWCLHKASFIELTNLLI